jgi:hypothetical protein
MWPRTERRSSRRRIHILALTLSAVLVALAALPASGALSVFVLDGAGGTSGRTIHAIGPDTANAVYAGNLWVFYRDSTAGNLRVGRRTDRWRFFTLDGAGGPNGRVDANVGSYVAAARYGGALHVFYSNDGTGDLRHGWYDGAAWHFQTLDGGGGLGGRLDAAVGSGISTTTFGGALYVSYVDRTHIDVRLARFNGSSWSFQTLDGAGGLGGRVDGDVGYNTRAAVFDGHLHVFSFFLDPFVEPDLGERIFGTVRQATRSGTGWTVRNVADINCCFDRQSLAVTRVTDDSVFLFFQNFGVKSINLRYREWNGVAWISETPNAMVEDAGFEFEDIGTGASAVTFDGRPFVYYHGFGNPFIPDGVRQAAWNGSSWDMVTLGVDFGHPTSSRVVGSRRIVFIGDATIPANQLGAHDLVQARGT